MEGLAFTNTMRRECFVSAYEDMWSESAAGCKRVREFATAVCRCGVKDPSDDYGTKLVGPLDEIQLDERRTSPTKSMAMGKDGFLNRLS